MWFKVVFLEFCHNMAPLIQIISYTVIPPRVILPRIISPLTASPRVILPRVIDIGSLFFHLEPFLPRPRFVPNYFRQQIPSRQVPTGDYYHLAGGFIIWLNSKRRFGKRMRLGRISRWASMAGGERRGIEDYGGRKQMEAKQRDAFYQHNK